LEDLHQSVDKLFVLLNLRKGRELVRCNIHMRFFSYPHAQIEGTVQALLDAPQETLLDLPCLLKVVFGVVFKGVDTGASGTIDAPKLARALIVLGAPEFFYCSMSSSGLPQLTTGPEEAEISLPSHLVDAARRIIRAVDVDGSETLDEQEFCAYLMSNYTDDLARCCVEVLAFRVLTKAAGSRAYFVDRMQAFPSRSPARVPWK
jgi:hypothetical protein